VLPVGVKLLPEVPMDDPPDDAVYHPDNEYEVVLVTLVDDVETDPPFPL
jgi:hypothetical protein